MLACVAKADPQAVVIANLCIKRADMIELLGEAALRSLAIACVLRLGIALFRITNADQEKLIWTTMLVGGIAMPALLRWPLMPTPQVLSFSLSTFAVHGRGLGEPGGGWRGLRFRTLRGQEKNARESRHHCRRPDQSHCIHPDRLSQHTVSVFAPRVNSP